MGKIAEVSQDTFEQEVLKSDIPVVVDFWAPWCGPCLAMTPVMEAAADQFSGKVKFTKVNVDDNAALASRYGIHSIPSIFIFKNGEIAESMIGFMSDKHLMAKLQAHAG